MILSGYSFFRAPRRLDRIASDLRNQKWLWVGARGFKDVHTHRAGQFMAGCMLDMAGVTERTYSYMKALDDHLEELFIDRNGKHKFWDEVLKSPIGSGDKGMSRGMCVSFM